MAEEDILSLDQTTSRNRLGLSAGASKSAIDDTESVMVNSSYKKLLAALSDKNLDDRDDAAIEDIPSIHNDDMSALDQTSDWADVDDPFGDLDGDELESAVTALTTALDFDPIMAAQDPALRPIEDDVSDAILRSRAVSDDALAEDSLGKREKPDALTQVTAMLHSGDVPVRRASIGERPLVAAPAADQSLDLSKLYQTAARFTPTMPLQSRPSAQPVPEALLRKPDTAPANDSAASEPPQKKPEAILEETKDKQEPKATDTPPHGEQVADAPQAPSQQATNAPIIDKDADAQAIIDQVIEQAKASAEPMTVPVEDDAALLGDDEPAVEPPAKPTPPPLIAGRAVEAPIQDDKPVSRPLMIVPAEPAFEDPIDADRDILAEASMMPIPDQLSDDVLDEPAAPPMSLSLSPAPLDEAPLHDRPVNDQPVNDQPVYDTPDPVQTKAKLPADTPEAPQKPARKRLKRGEHAEAKQDLKIKHQPVENTGFKKKNPTMMALTAATVVLTVGGIGLVAFHESPALQAMLGIGHTAEQIATSAPSGASVVASDATNTVAAIPSIDTAAAVSEQIETAVPEPVEPTDLATLADRPTPSEATELVATPDAAVIGTAEATATETTVVVADNAATAAVEPPATGTLPVDPAPALAPDTQTTVAALPPAVDTAPATAEPLRLAAPAPLPLPAELQALEASAIEGNRQAQHDLGAHFAAGRLIDQDFERAAYWFQEAAIRGVANAQYNMGVLLQQGLGVPMDPISALAWYRRAAENGHVEAQYNMGVAYADGIGVARDVPKAVRWFEQAAAAGIARAAFNLGVMYEVGMLGRPDLDAARQWYRQAATSGDRDADEALARLNGS